MFKFSASTLPINRIWENSFGLYKKTVGKTWYLAFIAALLPSLSSFWHKSGTLGTNFRLANLAYEILALLIVLYLSSVVMHYTYTLAASPNAKIGNSLRSVLAKYLTLFGATFFIYLVLFILLIIILAAVMGIKNIETLPVNVLLEKAGVGLIIWLVISLFALILCTFTTPSILFDNRGCFAAIKHSIKLVWKNWWRTFAAFFLPILLICVISILLQETVVNEPLNILVGALFTGLSLPFIQSIILVQFNDLKLRKKTT
jgi:hypothetical protein